MKKMIRISLGLNILVLIPIVVALANGSPRVDKVYGEATAGRGILVSIYLALLVLSVALIFKMIPVLVVPLLAIQVLYKVTTPLTVGTLLNPVVLSNLGIAALHLVTLRVIYKHREDLALKEI